MREGDFIREYKVKRGATFPGFFMSEGTKEVVTSFSEDDIETLIPHLEQRGFIIQKDETITPRVHYVTW